MLFGRKSTPGLAALFAGASLMLNPWQVLAQPSGQGEAQEAATERRPVSPAEFDENLAIGGEEVAARKVSSRMTTEVYVNGQGPYKFVVDSGADTSVIGESIAARLGLPDAGRVLLHSITESTVVDRVEVESLKLGPTETFDLKLPVLDERDIGGDGMIGLDALVEQRLLIDFEERIITLDEEYDFPSAGPDVIVVTARLERGQLILTQVQVEGKRAEAVVDTGTEVTIGNLAMRDRLKKRRNSIIQTVDIFGVTGARESIEFAIVPQIDLGSVTFTNVPIAFADLPPFEVFGLTDRPALLLGTDLMEKFRRVSLDFGDRKVRFQLKECRGRPTTIRTIRTSARMRANQDTACAP